MISPSIVNPIQASVKGLNRFGDSTIPRSGLIWYAKAPGMVDSIGLLTTRSQIHDSLWPIFYDDEGVKRSDSAAYALANSSPKLNESYMVGVIGDFVALYDKTTSQATLDKARKYAKAVVFSGSAIIGSATQWGLPQAPDWYVDSADGLDTNTGTSISAPLKTITALLSKTIQAGDVIGLKAGSHWRETLAIPADNVIVASYGAGAAPIVDGADVVTGWVQDGTYTNCYKISDTMPDNQADVNQAVWEDGVPLQGVASASACNSTPGTFYYGTITANVAYTIYIHPTGSTSPTTNGKTYEISKRKYCIHSTLNEDGVAVLGPIIQRRSYANGGVLRLAGVSQYARQSESYSESLHTVYLSQGEISGLKTTGSKLRTGANDIVFIQSPPLVDPSVSILSDFECVGNGNGLNQALLIHDDAIKRVHLRRGSVHGYKTGIGAGGRNGNIYICNGVDFRYMSGDVIARDDTTATTEQTELYIINCIVETSGFFPVKLTNYKGKIYIHRCFLIGTGYALFENVAKGGSIHIDHSILTRKTQGGTGINSTTGTAGTTLTVNNSIIYGVDTYYDLQQSGTVFSGDNNVYYNQTKIAVLNGSGYWEIGPWRTATGCEANSIISNPLFVSDPRSVSYPNEYNFNTQAGSPAKSRFAGIVDMPATYTAPAWVDAEVAALVNY